MSNKIPDPRSAIPATGLPKWVLPVSLVLGFSLFTALLQSTMGGLDRLCNPPLLLSLTPVRAARSLGFAECYSLFLAFAECYSLASALIVFLSYSNSTDYPGLLPLSQPRCFSHTPTLFLSLTASLCFPLIPLVSLRPCMLPCGHVCRSSVYAPSYCPCRIPVLSFELSVAASVSSQVHRRRLTCAHTRFVYQDAARAPANMVI